MTQEKAAEQEVGSTIDVDVGPVDRPGGGAAAAVGILGTPVGCRSGGLRVARWVQNIGEGIADAVTIDLPLPKGIFCLSQNEKLMIGDLKSGEKYLIEYELYTNNEYSSSSIPLQFKLGEKYKKYAEKWSE